MKIEETLENIGFNENESKIYLVLLGIGTCTASKLAERTDITRTLIYQIADKLIKRGVISYVIKGGVKYFSASDPKILLKELEEKKEQVSEILPKLMAMAGSTKEDTKVEVYQGKKGITSILKTILNDEKDYYFLGGAKEACSCLELENRIFVRNAIKKRIRGWILVQECDELFIGENEEYRYLNPKLVSLTSTIIWGNKTAIVIWSEPYCGIVVESEKIAKSNLSTFEYLWKTAKKPSKKDRKGRIV